MNINENLVLIMSSCIPIQKELTIGDDVVLNVTGSVVKIEDSDNQDGTVNRTYKIKGILGEVIKSGIIVNKREGKEIW